MRAFLAVALCLGAAATAYADPTIVVSSPWLRAAPKNASVAGGYATITNKGASPDRLVGASIPMAPKAEIHSMSMGGGIMQMKRLAKGLPIAPGATVDLTPGGYHLMFTYPKAPIKEGDSIKGTLIFEKAGQIPVTFPVAGFGAKAAPGKEAAPGK